jgi:hypothetical protein
MSNKRIFYACQAIEIQPIAANGTTSTAVKPKGVQSVGMNTNFNLEKIFQLGQIDLYDNIENNPEVEITVNKVFDGTVPVYLLAMGGGQVEGNIGDFANNRANVKLGIYSDTGALASGTAQHTVTCTGMYVSSVGFTFPTDGNATEDVTLVGNSKTWSAGGLSAFVPSSGPYTAPATARRWKFNRAESVFPTGAGGIGSTAPIQSVSVNADFGRESIYELGSYTPYHRYVNFPVEVTSEIEVLATTGDYLNISEATYSCTGTGEGRVQDKEIKFVICGSGTGDNLTIDLGKKNKITSVNYQGGDTGGGNATITYSFTTDNYLKVTANGTFESV